MIVTSRERCRLCGNCQRICRARARELVGKEMTVAEVIGEVEKDTVFYDESGGGVTLSGGEPLMQPAFLKELLMVCREKGIRSAVETCGLIQSETLTGIGADVDLWLYDLKTMDDPKHKKYTGASNKLVLHNLRLLSQVHDHVVVRFPLIPDMTDDASNIQEMGRFVSSLRSIREIHILPYHSGGIEKYKRLGKRYNLMETQPLSKEKLCEAADRLTKFGLEVKIGG
jgi:pyruvate formate lyase activating enzyme